MGQPHLTFQEYLAALALSNGHYKGRDASQSLAEQVVPLATPVSRRESPGERSSEEDVEAVPDSWREALRLLVSICKDDDVDAVLLSILHPGPGEEAAKTQGPRAVLAAQCLADEPNVGEDTANEVLRRFIDLIGKNDGLSVIQSNVEKVAQEVWSSHPDHRSALEACLLRAFMEPVALRGCNCGAVLAQLLGSSWSITADGLEEIFEMVRCDLESPDEVKVIRAALQVLELAYQQWFCTGEGLEDPLLALLGRGGACARAAAWALAWLSVRRPSGHSERRSIYQNRVLPPVLATEWEGVGAGGWQPTEEQTGVLLEALGRAAALEGELRRSLILLLGKSAQPWVVLPLLQWVVDPDASVREAAREALAWLANHLSSPLPSAQLDALEEQVGARLVSNESLAEAERCDGLVLVALFGQERLLRDVLADQGAPVALRRRAAEGLGLVAYRCGVADQRQRLREELGGWLRRDALDLLVRDAAGWVEHDRLLPLLQGASRGLQLAASADLPLLGSGLNERVPMLSLTALKRGEGLWIRTEVVTPPVWKLPLPECPGLEPQQLELVVVPGNEYEIGSPNKEDGRDFYTHFLHKCEGVNVEAQRRVSLKAFALVRHPISQAQWRTVAELPRMERHLPATPSSTKPVDLWERHAQLGGLPVECVSWYDCQEWLNRLNHWLKDRWPELGGQGEVPQLALPSETRWEVACQAGCDTPFHFGDTLDVSWANYNGNLIYGAGRKGIYRQRPASFGAFGLVNRWGLAEMHGQLWEWCADQWHPDPVEGALGDGSPLQGPDPELEGNQEQTYRLLRGGSWVCDPHVARAAMRDGSPPDGLYATVGVRPGCFSPPGRFLYT